MTDAAWGTLSNQAVAAAGVVYFLALLAYVVEWASLRAGRPVARVAAGCRRRRGRPSRDTGAPTSSGTEDRVDLFGRLGLAAHRPRAPPSTSWPWSPAGMSADPNRVPWGNMYEFTLSGTFVVVALYLVLQPALLARLARPGRRRLRADAC